MVLGNANNWGRLYFEATIKGKWDLGWDIPGVYGHFIEEGEIRYAGSDIRLSVANS